MEKKGTHGELGVHGNEKLDGRGGIELDQAAHRPQHQGELIGGVVFQQLERPLRVVVGEEAFKGELLFVAGVDLVLIEEDLGNGLLKPKFIGDLEGGIQVDVGAVLFDKKRGRLIFQEGLFTLSRLAILRLGS